MQTAAGVEPLRRFAEMTGFGAFEPSRSGDASADCCIRPGHPDRFHAGGFLTFESDLIIQALALGNPRS